MSLATHAFIGAAVVNIMPNHPMLGIFLAFGSHFILDFIPHWDYRLGSLSFNDKEPMKSSMQFNSKFLKDLVKISADGLLGTAISLAVFPGLGMLTLAGAAFGMLPDFLQAVYYRFKKEPLISIQRFHMWIHSTNHMRNQKWLSIASQVFLIILASALL
ncbi:MAG: hypothetical protein Q8Q06_03775 [bacterium]|nr:hypothetical protein [bacterium]